jgi:hypothetical protein
MQGHCIIDPPFVPDQSYRDRRTTCVILYQPTGKWCAEQRQAILRQTKDQDDPQICQRVRADIKIHMENGRYVRSSEVPIDERLVASISTIVVSDIRTSFEQ